jgi:hypothetical protein
MAFAENTDTFLADFGVPVVSGDVSGLGIYDAPGALIAGGRSISNEYSVLVKFSDFGTLKFKDAITVNAVAYTVRQNMPEDDGVFTRITLQKV